MSTLRVLTIAGLISPLAVFGNSQSDHVVLLQQRAEVLSRTVHKGRISHHHEASVHGFGETVSISEKGYQLVAELKNDREMKKFIRRVAEKEARQITDEAELSGFAPYYSGTIRMQSLSSLKQELRRVQWVTDGEGRTAPLSEIGYMQVAKLKSRPHMLAYARRILDAYHKKCSDEGALMGLMAYFDGEISIQSFAQLQKELLSAPWAVARDSESMSPPLSLASEKGPLDVLGWFGHGDASSATDDSDANALNLKVAGDSSGHQKHKSTQMCHEWCGKNMFIKVEANSTVLKDLSSWGMKCSWAHCGGCSACSDPSLELEAPRRKHEKKGQALHIDEDVCEEWCSGDEFEVVHQNATATKAFSWDMKCGWRYCRACGQCKGDQGHLSLVSMHGPFDFLGSFFGHDSADDDDDTETGVDVDNSSEENSSVQEDTNESEAGVETGPNGTESGQNNSTQMCEDWCDKNMFIKVEANSTVLKDLSSWGMKCSWAHCGGCSACSDPSLELEPPRRKHEKKGQALHIDEDVCEDWCSSDEFEVVHQNATATKAFSWDMKCGWQYCGGCTSCN